MTDEKQYRVILKAEHIQEILGIGKVRAYEIMEIDSFPLIRLGRSKRVKRDQFFKWLDEQGDKAI